VSSPLAPREAALRILEHVRPQPALRVPLDDALDAVLAEDITSPLDLPAWPNSAMDGYAARSQDVRGARPERPTTLQVLESIPAGAFPSRTLSAGTCARIFTGAPLPEGADSVIRQEDTDQGAQVVRIFDDRDAGMNVRAAGEDIRRGTLALPIGTVLGPAQLGMLAALGVANPMIYRRPRVGLLSSGDEIADVDQPDQILSGRKIGSSNSHSLRAQIRRAGGEPVDLGIARDTRDSLRDHLSGAPACDLLITTAGISVGEHDHLRAVMAELGAELAFWRLAMRPGAPVGFGMLGPLPWVGLPGNPVSAMVTFELFGRSAIRRLAGHRNCFRRAVAVRVAEPIRVAPHLQHFLRVVVSEGPTGPEARLTGAQGSGILSSMVKANALLIIPQGQPETPPGATALAIPLEGTGHVALPPF